jgi:hypothetical protein
MNYKLKAPERFAALRGFFYMCFTVREQLPVQAFLLRSVKRSDR